MNKLLIGTICLFFTTGCHPGTKITTKEEYTEKTEWDEEKGWIRRPKTASWSASWKN